MERRPNYVEFATIAAPAVPTLSPRAMSRRIQTLYVQTLCLGLVGWLLASAVWAQNPSMASPRGGPLAMERLVLQEGEPLEGLLLDDDEQQLEFAQLLRPPGKPMQAFIRAYPRKDVVRLDRLQGAQREQLLKRYEGLKNRAAIEAGRIYQIQLTAAADFAAAQDASRLSPMQLPLSEGEWVYQGDWFVFASSLPPAAMKRVIVRVEQVFRAYRHLLPPRRRARSPLVIRLTGDEGEYRRILLKLDLETSSPAVFLPQSNRIFASTRLGPLSRQVADIDARHQRMRSELETRLEEFGEQFAKSAETLAAQGYNSDDIADERRARLAALQREAKALVGRMDAADRRNEQTFAKASHEALRRLYHEAFHAYLENYVFDSATKTVPRWLNEGLAQVFEHAQLDGDYLRIDIAPQALTTAVRQGLALRPLPLSVLLASKAGDFHGRQDPALAQQLYTESWGLAFYLTFHAGVPTENLLSALRAEQSASAEASNDAALESIEELLLRHAQQAGRQRDTRDWLERGGWRRELLK